MDLVVVEPPAQVEDPPLKRALSYEVTITVLQGDGLPLRDEASSPPPLGDHGGSRRRRRDSWSQGSSLGSAEDGPSPRGAAPRAREPDASEPAREGAGVQEVAVVAPSPGAVPTAVEIIDGMEALKIIPSVAAGCMSPGNPVDVGINEDAYSNGDLAGLELTEYFHGPSPMLSTEVGVYPAHQPSLALGLVDPIEAELETLGETQNDGYQPSS
nr:unnamed protein product [Digitaria exilis]